MYQSISTFNWGLTGKENIPFGEVFCSFEM